MTKLKKGLIQLALASALILVTVLGITACGSKVSAISIGRNDMPRLTYVEGQDLDLSQGLLTVEYGDGKVETLPLDSADITVTGYDKTVLGSQTVTVSYGDQTTSFETTVISRLSVVNAQTVYYVGEEFDASRGRLTVANDDATTFSVSFSEDTVSFRGFDSSSPVGNQTVTVIYKNGNAEYSTDFHVTIYSTENAKLTPPNKTSYRSHEEFRVNGAYITYSNGNSVDDKIIPVTEDMISNIDFSAVTEQNSPMVQTGLVTYGGKQFEFSVTVTYSDVTRLQELLQEYAFEWTEPSVPVISEALGEHAVECVELYLSLSSTERAYIDSSIEAAVRIATVYTYERWYADLQACSNSFGFTESGLIYYLPSYAAADADYKIVSDEEKILNASLGFLGQIGEVFSDLAIGGVKMGDYLSLVKSYKENKDGIVKALAFTTKLYMTLSDIPEDWSDLSAYGVQINAAKELVTSGEFGSAAYRDVFALVSTWRKNDDFFDIVYSYYVQAEDTESIEALKNIILPTELNVLYDYLHSSLLEYMNIAVGSDGSVSTDSTLLVYYYRRAREIAAGIVAGGSALNKDLYETLAFDGILITSEGEPLPATFEDLFDFMEQTQFGYFDLLGGVMDDPEILSLWDTYLDLLMSATEDEIPAKVKGLLEQLVSLSPGQQKSFLLSVNVYYDGYDKLSLDTELNYTYLIRILKSYYAEALSEEEFDILHHLLLAIEYYASISDKDGAVSGFLQEISTVKTAYESLGNKAVFDENFAAIYEKYLGFAALYDENGTLRTYTVEETWQAVLNELYREIDKMFYAYSLIVSEEEEQFAADYIRLFASYETACDLVDLILNSGNGEVIGYYYHHPVPFFEEYSWTLDYAFSVQAKGLAVLNYAGLYYSDRTLWEIVADDVDLRTFFKDVASIVWLESATENTVEMETVSALMKKYLALTTEEKVIFHQLQGIDANHAYYYDGLSEIFGASFEGQEKILSAANTLLEAENAMAVYWAYRDMTEDSEDYEEYLSALQTVRDCMAALEAAINALSQEEKVVFNGYFSEIVRYYQSEFKQLPAVQ